MNLVEEPAFQECTVSFFNAAINNVDVILYLPVMGGRVLDMTDFALVILWIPKKNVTMWLSFVDLLE